MDWIFCLLFLKIQLTPSYVIKKKMLVFSCFFSFTKKRRRRVVKTFWGFVAVRLIAPAALFARFCIMMRLRRCSFAFDMRYCAGLRGSAPVPGQGLRPCTLTRAIGPGPIILASKFLYFYKREKATGYQSPAWFFSRCGAGRRYLPALSRR